MSATMRRTTGSGAKGVSIGRLVRLPKMASCKSLPSELPERPGNAGGGGGAARPTGEAARACLLARRYQSARRDALRPGQIADDWTNHRQLSPCSRRLEGRDAGDARSAPVDACSRGRRQELASHRRLRRTGDNLFVSIGIHADVGVFPHFLMIAPSLTLVIPGAAKRRPGSPEVFVDALPPSVRRPPDQARGQRSRLQAPPGFPVVPPARRE